MAAAADTIVILDGLRYEQVDTADIYTQDHATNSSVFSKPFYIPLAYKAARVKFNGAYDPDGGRVHYRTKLLRTTSITTPTKTANQGQTWQTLTPPAVAHSTEYDVSASWYSEIIVDVCQSSADANTTGVEIIIEGRKEDSEDEWVEITRQVVLSLGAATKSDCLATEPIDETIIAVNNPTAGNLNHVSKLAFLEDTATVGECEIIYVVECGADA